MWECSPQHCFSPHMKINHRLLNILRKVSSKKDQKSLLMSEEAAWLPLLWTHVYGELAKTIKIIIPLIWSFATYSGRRCLVWRRKRWGNPQVPPNFTKTDMNKITFQNQLCCFSRYIVWDALLQTIVFGSACSRVLCRSELIDVFKYAILSAFVATEVTWNV